MASKLYDYTPDQLQKLLDESNSYADLLRKVNMCEHGANRRTLNKIINEFNLDLTQIRQNRKEENLKQLGKIQNKKIPMDEILKKNSIYKSSALQKRLVNEGYKMYKCECCGISEWRGKRIVLQLHHKDGDRHNNELDNLQILCPNCHSQTDNFCGKNKPKKIISSLGTKRREVKKGISENGERLYDGYGNYKVLCPFCKKNFMNKEAKKCKACFSKERKMPKVSKEELFSIMETNTYTSAAKLLGVDRKTVSRWHKYYSNQEREKGNMVIGSDKAPPRDVLKMKIRSTPFIQIGKEYGVSDNSVRKWCDAYGLPRKVSVIKSITDKEWIKI